MKLGESVMKEVWFGVSLSVTEGRGYDSNALCTCMKFSKKNKDRSLNKPWKL